MSSIKKEIISYFQSQSEESLLKDFISWNAKCNNWLNRAYNFIYSQQNIKELEKTQNFHLNKTATQSYKDWIYNNQNNLQELLDQQKEEIKAYKNLQEARNNLRINILKDGYKILNEIGETIRNETILYSITATSNGTDIDTADLTKTWTLSLDSFLSQAVTFSSSRIILKDSSVLYNTFEENNSKEFLAIQEWDKQRKINYQTFKQIVTSTKKYQKVNQGNLLEGFLNWEQNSHTNMLGAFIESIRGNEAFYRKGDINNIQVKGPSASVTNISSLIRAIENVKSILNNPDFYLKGINKEIREQVDSLNIESQIDKATEKIAKNLLKMFGG